MAQLPHGAFNAAEVDPSGGVGPDPEFTGWHKAHITDSEMKQTKAGTGQYLQMVAEVLDGKFKGRKLWIRLNLVNPNQTAVDIAYRDLSAICHAAGVLNVSDSQQLHHRPIMVNVAFKPAAGTNPAGNEVTGYKPVGGAPQAAAPAPAAQAAEAPPAAPAAAAPPWARKAG